MTLLIKRKRRVRFETSVLYRKRSVVIECQPFFAQVRPERPSDEVRGALGCHLRAGRKARGPTSQGGAAGTPKEENL
jgi:hypothetical protein